MKEPYLIEADDLADAIQARNAQGNQTPSDDYFIIDTRDPSVFQKSHLPGAVNVPEIFTYLCRSDNGGYEAMVRTFNRLLGNAGLKPTDKVVLYEDAMDNGYGQSCRGWFILNYLGHPGNVMVLHGGFRAWLAKSKPLSATTSPYPATTYDNPVDQSIMVTNQQMQEAINDPRTAIVDVRDYAEWIGANSSPYGYDFCPRKGRIPGARWLEWYRLMRHKGGIPWMRSKEEILSLCEQLEISPATRVYVYCFKGARTSNTMLALKLAGIQDVRNYFMSWNEWSRDATLPISEGYPDN